MVFEKKYVVITDMSEWDSLMVCPDSIHYPMPKYVHTCTRFNQLDQYFEPVELCSIMKWGISKSVFPAELLSVCFQQSDPLLHNFQPVISSSLLKQNVLDTSLAITLWKGTPHSHLLYCYRVFASNHVRPKTVPIWCSE